MESYLTASAECELGIGSQDQVKRQLALIEEAQEKTETVVSQLGAAKTELSIVDLQLKKMTFTAPCDGIVLKRSKNPGAVVSFGDPVYILCDPNRVWIETEISENEIGNIAVGTAARVRLPAYPKKEFVGHVSYIGPATVAKSSFAPSSGHKVTIPVQIAIDSGSVVLKPGLSASVGLKVH
jgi:multidrug resistance efflux pump